jgi:hypothetical protein
VFDIHYKTHCCVRAGLQEVRASSVILSPVLKDCFLVRRRETDNGTQGHSAVMTSQMGPKALSLWRNRRFMVRARIFVPNRITE